jgi:hypothetical protein
VRADRVTLGRPAFPRKKPRLDGRGAPSLGQGGARKSDWRESVAGLKAILQPANCPAAPLMSGLGRKRKGSKRAHHGRFAPESGLSTIKRLSTIKLRLVPIDGVAGVLELPFAFPGAAIIHFGKGDTSKVGTCLTCTSPPLIYWRALRDSNPCFRRERAMS